MSGFVTDLVKLGAGIMRDGTVQPRPPATFAPLSQEVGWESLVDGQMVVGDEPPSRSESAGEGPIPGTRGRLRESPGRARLPALVTVPDPEVFEARPVGAMPGRVRESALNSEPATGGLNATLSRGPVASLGPQTEPGVGPGRSGVKYLIQDRRDPTATTQIQPAPAPTLPRATTASPVTPLSEGEARRESPAAEFHEHQDSPAVEPRHAREGLAAEPQARRDGVPVDAPPRVNGGSSGLPARNHAAVPPPEPRPVQVRIGAIEVRAPAPAAVTAPPRGFGDYFLARNYVSRRR